MAGASNVLLRANLQAWQLQDLTPLVPGCPQSVAQALLVLPGHTDKVAAVVATNSTPTVRLLRLYVAGHSLSNEVHAISSWSHHNLLAAAPSGSTLWCLWGNILSRFAITDQGVTLEQVEPARDALSLDIRAGELIASHGATWSAVTGDALTPFQASEGAVSCLAAARDVAIFTGWNRTIGYFDIASRAQIASQQVPEPSSPFPLPAPSRLLPWGDRGLAVAYASVGVIQTFESPALAPGLADLVVNVLAPASVALPEDPGAGAGFVAEVTVTNVGLVNAPGIELQWNDGGIASLGTLAPGESRTVPLPRDSGYTGLMVTWASVRCALFDATPENNYAEAVTAFQRPDIYGSRQLVLGLNYLVAAPDGTRLYAALSRDKGASTNGIAVIQPEIPSVERILGAAAPVGLMSVSDDGQWLYAVLGTTAVGRWNLATATNDLIMDLAPESIVDLRAVPGSPRTVVVATDGRIRAFDDAAPRLGEFIHSYADKRLGFVGDQLWLADVDGLRSFDLLPAGLQSTGTFPAASFLEISSGAATDVDCSSPGASSILKPAWLNLSRIYPTPVWWTASTRPCMCRPATRCGVTRPSLWPSRHTRFGPPRRTATSSSWPAGAWMVWRRDAVRSCC